MNGGEWRCGGLETPSLAELRRRAGRVPSSGTPTTVREVVADVRALHADPANAGALFQVASQFNLLEMAGPDLVPEDGVGIYERDFTQGPACAIAAGAGTIYRNYFASVGDAVGQTADNQVDCLADLGDRLGNADGRLWEMVNGYALPTAEGLGEVNARLGGLDEPSRDELRGLLRIGVQTDTEVTLPGTSHVVTQAFCSAVPVAYTEHPAELWRPLAVLILEAAYEATLCAAVVNAARTGNDRLFLTLLGGGAFGNQTEWILDALRRAVNKHIDRGLDIAIVSYGRSQPAVRGLAEGLNARTG